MLTKFEFTAIDANREDDLKAEARYELHRALIRALKERGVGSSLKSKSLAQALGKDPAYVSRVINGGSISYETLSVFLEALNFLPAIEMKKFEDLPAHRPNVDVRPKIVGQVLTKISTHSTAVSSRDVVVSAPKLTLE